MWKFIKQFFISLVTPNQKELIPVKIYVKPDRPLHTRQMKVNTKHRRGRH
jgi:hypothetical protein